MKDFWDKMRGTVSGIPSPYGMNDSFRLAQMRETGGIDIPKRTSRDANGNEIITKSHGLYEKTIYNPQEVPANTYSSSFCVHDRTFAGASAEIQKDCIYLLNVGDNSYSIIKRLEFIDRPDIVARRVFYSPVTDNFYVQRKVGSQYCLSRLSTKGDVLNSIDCGESIEEDYVGRLADLNSERFPISLNGISAGYPQWLIDNRLNIKTSLNNGAYDFSGYYDPNYTRRFFPDGTYEYIYLPSYGSRVAPDYPVYTFLCTTSNGKVVYRYFASPFGAQEQHQLHMWQRYWDPAMFLWVPSASQFLYYTPTLSTTVEIRIGDKNSPLTNYETIYSYAMTVGKYGVDGDLFAMEQVPWEFDDIHDNPNNNPYYKIYWGMQLWKVADIPVDGDAGTYTDDIRRYYPNTVSAAESNGRILISFSTVDWVYVSGRYNDSYTYGYNYLGNRRMVFKKIGGVWIRLLDIPNYYTEEPRAGYIPENKYKVYGWVSRAIIKQ